MISCNMPADILSEYAKEVFSANPILCHLTKSLMNRIYSFIKDVQYAVDVEEDTVFLHVITYSGNKEDNQFFIDETLSLYKELFDYIGYKINVTLNESYSGIN